MSTVETTETPWDDYSGDSGNCVQMRRTAEGEIEVRDKKDQAGPVLSYSKAEIGAWLEGAKKGHFDYLID